METEEVKKNKGMDIYNLTFRQKDRIKYGLIGMIDKPTNRSNNEMCKYLLNKEYTIQYIAELPWNGYVTLYPKLTQHSERLFLQDKEYPYNFEIKLTPDILVSQYVYDNLYAYVSLFCEEHSLLNKFYYYSVEEYDDYLKYHDLLQEFIDKQIAYRYIRHWGYSTKRLEFINKTTEERVA